MNRKKDMIYGTLWIEREELKKLKKLLSKEIKTDGDLELIGDIFSRINTMGDFKC